MRVIFTIVLFSIALVAQGQHHHEADQIYKSIFFGGGSYYIDDEQAGTLVHWLDSIPNLLEKYEIHLVSHTDPIGGKEYNEWLSEMRAQAVQQLLLDSSIPEHKISKKSWGLENPIYSNDTYSGMQMNRRVDVILYPIIF